MAELIPNAGPALGMLNKILGFVFLAALIGAMGWGAYAVWRWLRFKRIIYNTDLHLWIQRDKGNKEYAYDELDDVGGSLMSRKGMVEKFHVKGLNKWIKPPKSSWMTYSKGRRKLKGILIDDTIFPVTETLMKKGDGDFKSELQIIEPDMVFHHLNLIDDLERNFKKQTWWDRYGAVTMIAVGVMLNMIFVYVISNNMVSMAQSLNSASINFRDAMQTCRESVVPQKFVEAEAVT